MDPLIKSQLLYQLSYAPGLPACVVSSHAVGFLILSFLLSFLWFRINRVGVFPLGFVGALVVA